MGQQGITQKRKKKKKPHSQQPQVVGNLQQGYHYQQQHQVNVQQQFPNQFVMPQQLQPQQGPYQQFGTQQQITQVSQQPLAPHGHDQVAPGDVSTTMAANEQGVLP